MLTVGNRLPNFSLNACLSTQSGKEFGTVTNATYKDKWLVLFFWPLDFTFVCPTEIEDFAAKAPEFARRNAQVLGGSIDSPYVHLAWRNADRRLSNIPFPMLSDIKREFSTALGILHPEEGVALRATFIVDSEGVIRFASVNDLPTGRNVNEVLRTLDALQTGALCPVNWQKGQETL